MAAHSPCWSQHVHINNISQANGAPYPPPQPYYREEVLAPCEESHSCTTCSYEHDHCSSYRKSIEKIAQCTCEECVAPERDNYVCVKECKHHESEEEEHYHRRYWSSGRCAEKRVLQKPKSSSKYFRRQSHSRRRQHRSSSQSAEIHRYASGSSESECCYESDSESLCGSSSVSSCCSHSRGREQSHREMQYLRGVPGAGNKVAKQETCTCEAEGARYAYGPPMPIMMVDCSYH